MESQRLSCLEIGGAISLYPWKRFWCPRGAPFALSDGGYLADPESEFGSYRNPNVVPFETIADLRCLVLLGQPGIGKSTSLCLEHEASRSELTSTGDRTLWCDLRSCADGSLLIRNLFEHPTFAGWVNGTGHLHLFLDSLDEALLQFRSLPTALLSELRRCPIERLFLRVACRPADWPASFEHGLSHLFGASGVNAFELTPLRRVDVRAAAEQRAAADVDAFLREISSVEAVPLAIIPVTLELLLALYQTEGRFPSSQADLYERGCRRLCAEANLRRHETRSSQSMSSDQRLEVASRLAAVTLFAHRGVVWTGVDRVMAPAGTVTPSEMSGGHEIAHGQGFEVGEAEIAATLDTGLFSPRGPNSLGWTHQTFAEYLAARYLARHQATIQQVESVIIDASDPAGRVVPQLRETAAWLAAMDRATLQRIMDADPFALLGVGAVFDVLTHENQAELVDKLLAARHRGALPDLDWSVYRRLGRLRHPEIAGQLRPWLTDSSLPNPVRRMAVEMVAACDVRPLQDVLLDIALRPAETMKLREDATRALAQVGDDATRRELMPLVFDTAGEDPYDQLKGYALQALWPGQISVEELFGNLTAPKRSNFFGAYRWFLLDHLAPNLQASDIPIALAWIQTQFRTGSLQAVRYVIGPILRTAWRIVDAPEVARQLAVILLELAEFGRHDPFISLDKLFDDAEVETDERRRRIIDSLLENLDHPENNVIALVDAFPSLVVPRDVDWLLTRYSSEASDDQKMALARLLRTTITPQDTDQLEAILERCHGEPILSRVLAPFFAPLPAGAESRREPRRQPASSPSEHRPLEELQERVKSFLGKVESGDLAAWWGLDYELTAGHGWQPSLTETPSWARMDAATKSEMLSAAERYLLGWTPSPERWIHDRHKIPLADYAGYRGIRLIAEEEPRRLNLLPLDVWRKWAPVIMAFPDFEQSDAHKALIETLYGRAPEETAAALSLLIERDHGPDTSLAIVGVVEDILDDRLAEVILQATRNPQLHFQHLEALLVVLLDHGVEEAKQFAESLVRTPPPSDEPARSRAIVAAGALLTHAADGGWTVVYSAIREDASLADAVVALVARDDRHGAATARHLSEDQLADFYVWLARRYPHADDPQPQTVHGEIPRLNIAYYRDLLLRSLEERANPQAVAAMRRIALALPHLTWLSDHVLHTEELARRGTWIAPSPEQVLKLLSERDLRLVYTADQLLEVVIESLDRLDRKLHQQEARAVVDLWNVIARAAVRGIAKGVLANLRRKLGRGKPELTITGYWSEFGNEVGVVSSPKEENLLSDYVKRHLDDDLQGRRIIINREVENRPRSITDIRVDAVGHDRQQEADHVLTVIIEVKGCWHPRLREAMKTQLGRCASSAGGRPTP
jgi:hypothetical protein